MIKLRFDINLTPEEAAHVIQLAERWDRKPNDMVRHLVRFALKTFPNLPEDEVPARTAFSTWSPATRRVGTDLAASGAEKTTVTALPPGDCGDPFEKPVDISKPATI